jgi:hypothetical protein
MRVFHGDVYGDLRPDIAKPRVLRVVDPSAPVSPHRSDQRFRRAPVGSSLDPTQVRCAVYVEGETPRIEQIDLRSLVPSPHVHHLGNWRSTVDAALPQSWRPVATIPKLLQQAVRLEVLAEMPSDEKQLTGLGLRPNCGARRRTPSISQDVYEDWFEGRIIALVVPTPAKVLAAWEGVGAAWQPRRSSGASTPSKPDLSKRSVRLLHVVGRSDLGGELRVRVVDPPASEKENILYSPRRATEPLRAHDIRRLIAAHELGVVTSPVSETRASSFRLSPTFTDALRNLRDELLLPAEDKQGWSPMVPRMSTPRYEKPAPQRVGQSPEFSKNLT